MSKQAFRGLAVIVTLVSGCGSKPPAPAKSIPPTPKVSDFQGASSPAPQKGQPDAAPQQR